MPTPERRLTILGGGGFRVPLVYGALLGADAPVTEVVLYDVDHGRLAAISRVLRAQAAGVRHAPRVSATTDLTGALTGASFVFSAIRVHGLAGRVIDERVAIGEGVLGQAAHPDRAEHETRTGERAGQIGGGRHPRRVPDPGRLRLQDPADRGEPAVVDVVQDHLGDRRIGAEQCAVHQRHPEPATAEDGQPSLRCRHGRPTSGRWWRWPGGPNAAPPVG